MGMSTVIYMAKEKSEEWKMKLSIQRNCEELGIETPSEITKYFDDRDVEDLEADDFGELSEDIDKDSAITGHDGENKYAVDMEEMVSKGYKYVIFSNSW